MSNVMTFYNRSFTFKDNKLYKCTPVLFRDCIELEEELIYDPEKDPIERLYRTFEEIFLAGHGEFKNKVKTLFDC
jgi:hypothetical protein